MSDALVNDLATALRNIAGKSRGRGMRISFELVCEALDGDEKLARKALSRAGFTPPLAAEWTFGKGGSTLSDHGYPDLFFETLTDILDDHDAL